jgi:hypothetical protein
VRQGGEVWERGVSCFGGVGGYAGAGGVDGEGGQGVLGIPVEYC